MSGRTETAQESVKRWYPNTGAQLSAAHGWRILDYTDQKNPTILNRGTKTEAAAWRSVASRRGWRGR